MAGFNKSESTNASVNSKGSCFGRGKKYHEVYSKKYIHDESRHMPSLTESAGRAVSKKCARLVSSGTSGTRGRYRTCGEERRTSCPQLKKKG
jgi:hypothetical protein